MLLLTAILVASEVILASKWPQTASEVKKTVSIGIGIDTRLIFTKVGTKLIWPIAPIISVRFLVSSEDEDEA